MTALTVEKTSVLHILSVFVALVIQDTKRMRSVILSSVAFLTFLHYLIKGMIFGKELLNIKFVFSFSLQLLSETFLIPRIIQRGMVFIYTIRYPCQFLMKIEFPRQSFAKKIYKYQILLKSFQ
jgi:hypothetical protein